MTSRRLRVPAFLAHDAGIRRDLCADPLETEAIMPLDSTNGTERALRRLAVAAMAGLTLVACEPTVRVEAPKEPITINLNIKIEAEVRVKLEEKAKEDIEANPGLF
jgi:hypothetical protein